MRDPARIDRILAALGEYWKANPDLRLGQIVANLTVKATERHVAAPEIFYVEDDKIEIALRPLANADLQAFYQGSNR
jgi:hypothetical protein